MGRDDKTFQNGILDQVCRALYPGFLHDVGAMMLNCADTD